MKKRLLLIALASTMLLAACNKNNNESQGEAVFTATTEHQGGRTSLDPNNGNIKWTAGDQIVIANDNNETAIFSLRSGEGTTEGGFGTADDFNTVGPFVAAYPETATIANDVVTFNLPATQAMGETGTFANGANPMVACSDDKNLQFKNLCGGLGIRLKGVGAHVSAVRITSKNTSEKLWGAYEVSNCASNEPTLTEASGNQGTNVITLTCDVTLTTAAKTFFVMLPPGTLANGFTMEVLDGNEVLATKETTSDIAFVERNNVKVFNEILIDVEFDGNVEIPVGMSESDIFVTNFNDDAIPDENGDFVIGYSKLLMAMNSNNGKLVYFTVNSVDGNILKGESDNNVDYELSAKETALFLTLRCLPFSMRRASDASLSTFKEILYSLQCVKDLETAIQNVVDTYGYLKEDELVDAMNTLKTFLYNELGLNLGDGKREMKEVVQNTNGKNEELQSPYLPDDAEFGTRFFIKDKYHSTLSPEKWTINCTGYNGLPTAFGVVKGQVEGRKSIGEEGGDRNFFIDFEYDENEVMYYLAPTGLMNVIDVLTLSDWQGFKRLFQELYYMIHNQTTIPMDFYKSTTDNMQFDLYEPTLGNSNALCVIAPMDNINVYIVNCVFTVMDLFDFALPTYKLDEIIQDFLNDQDYVAMFMSQIQNGAEGRQIILAATEVKFFALAASTLIQSGIQYYLPELAQTLSGLDLIANSFDIVAEISSALYLRSFALSVIAEYSNPPTILPSVTTGTYTVNGTTATISGSLNSIGSYSIAELGVCYSTSQNPSPWSDACAPAEGTDVGTFECVIENLQPNTTYYARAYAKTWVEPLAGYGDDVRFTTGNYGLPLVTTYPVNLSDITTNSAIFRGKVEGETSHQIVTRGFCYSTTPYFDINTPGVVTINAGSGMGEFTANATGLSANTTYYYKAYIVTEEDEPFHGQELHFSTLPSSGGGDDHAYVDLGLPSGLLWATCNVGANAPEDYGDYFAWGETQPKDNYNWNTYQHCNGIYNTLTKYCQNSSYGYNGYTDELTTLLPEDDAATANWGGNWRMPTEAEWKELYQNTTHTWTTQNGEYGQLFTATNGESLFLPAAGYRVHGISNPPLHVGSYGEYWSSSLSGSEDAWYFFFSSGSYYMNFNYRYIGQSVRPVRASGQK